MSVYRIRGFSEGPHWDVAVVEADSEESAEEILRAHLSTVESDTVWTITPEDEWEIYEHNSMAEGAVYLVLGAGCR
jgi:hypothetical protein